MQWEFVVALALAIPVILFPAAFVWYLNIGGIYSAVRQAREKRAALAGRLAGPIGERPVVTDTQDRAPDAEPGSARR
ncbi:MAG: hypothetical protein Q8O40_12100 [Chloroflexota bacterium]|nr:hypothetical protein [Chloroflexota bacterium]